MIDLLGVSLQAAQAVAEVAQAAVPEQREFYPLVTSAAVIMYVQRFLKSRPSYMKLVQAIPMADVWIHRSVAGFGSLVAALGIHYTFSWSFHDGGHLQAQIPAGWQLLQGLGDWFNVGLMQQLFYDMSRKPIGMTHDQPSQVVARTSAVDQK